MDVTKLIRKLLNGTGEKPAAAKIEKLRSIQKAAQANLDELQKKRAQAYLDDIDDEAIKAIESEIERLEEAEQAKREQAIDATLAPYFASLEDAANRVEAADAAMAALSLIWNRDEHILSQHMKPQGFIGVLGRGFGSEWANTIRRNVAVVRAARGTGPQLAAPAIVPRVSARPLPVRQPPRLTDSQRPVSIALSQETSPKQPRPADDSGPLDPGEIRVKVLRAGFSPAEDRPQAHYGQIVRMSVSAARRAAGAGAVEIMDEAPSTESAQGQDTSPTTKGEIRA